MQLPHLYLNEHVNSGPWLTGYTLDELLARSEDRIVLPICSLGTSFEQLAELAPLVLPPLYHEAMDDDLKGEILNQVRRCFPFHHQTTVCDDYAGPFEIVELPAATPEPPAGRPRILGFSVDTAVEEHGPHLPLATDTIQSYAVLHRLAEEYAGFVVGPPVEYGHLTWGLPFGMSIDLTPQLTARYVTGFANAMQAWLQPEAMLVVDVHGSIVHRAAIEQGLKDSVVEHWTFRWLHERLVEFAGDRGDQHAGGVETALVEFINPGFLNARWWPNRMDDLAAKQMSLEQAVELTPDLPRFIQVVEEHGFNGIVGDVKNYDRLDANELFERMMAVARIDAETLNKALQ